jgi:hypothetical protein
MGAWGRALMACVCCATGVCQCLDEPADVSIPWLPGTHRSVGSRLASLSVRSMHSVPADAQDAALQWLVLTMFVGLMGEPQVVCSCVCTIGLGLSASTAPLLLLCCCPCC